MGFFDILMKPDEVLAIEKPKANTVEAVKTYAIYGAIIGLVYGLIFGVLFGVIGTVAGAASAQAGGLLAGLGLAIIVVMPILGIVGSVVGSAIGWGILMLLAKVLGGKGTFAENFYLDRFRPADQIAQQIRNPLPEFNGQGRFLRGDLLPEF